MKFFLVKVCKYKKQSYLCTTIKENNIAEWSSWLARWAHNPKVAGSSPASATKKGTPFFIRKSSLAQLVRASDC